MVYSNLALDVQHTSFAFCILLGVQALRNLIYTLVNGNTEFNLTAISEIKVWIVAWQLNEANENRRLSIYHSNLHYLNVIGWYFTSDIPMALKLKAL